MFAVYLLTLGHFRLLIQTLRQPGSWGWTLQLSLQQFRHSEGEWFSCCASSPTHQWALNQRGKDASKQILHRPAGSTPSPGVVTSPVPSHGEVFPSPQEASPQGGKASTIWGSKFLLSLGSHYSLLCELTFYLLTFGCKNAQVTFFRMGTTGVQLEPLHSALALASLASLLPSVLLINLLVTVKFIVNESLIGVLVSTVRLISTGTTVITLLWSGRNTPDFQHLAHYYRS